MLPCIGTSVVVLWSLRMRMESLRLQQTQLPLIRDLVGPSVLIPMTVNAGRWPVRYLFNSYLSEKINSRFVLRASWWFMLPVHRLPPHALAYLKRGPLVGQHKSWNHPIQYIVLDVLSKKNLIRAHVGLVFIVEARYVHRSFGQGTPGTRTSAARAPSTVR